MLDGRVVLVTGGSTGIGRELARGLEDAGAVVGVVEGPVASRGDAQRAFGEAADGRAVHAVVHAHIDAGALQPAPLAETDDEEWDTRCEGVLRTALWCAQAAFRVLRERGGRLVLVTPTISLTGRAELVPYATAAEGIRSMAKSAARQWGAHGITVTCVATPVELMVDDSTARTDPTIGEPALGRLPDARTDVAPVIASLLEDGARFVTGTTVVVDGGVVMTP
jgi:NAD(P)-dependent dehydrogenase (short-subunit alcohol dehydrogenase family)